MTVAAARSGPLTCVAGASQAKPHREAEQALADYIAKKYQPERNRRDIEDIDCADVLSIYLSDVGEPADQFEIIGRIERLNEYWGGKTLSAVNAQTCGAYVKHRGNQGGARRDLETLRAAINHHAKEGFHRGVVRVSLPPKGEARDRWLTRKEAAVLIWHCWRHREKQTVHAGSAKGRPVLTHKRPLQHVARFILIGLYTGTCAGAIATASPYAEQGRSFIDLERGIFYRKAIGKRATKKRQTPAPIPPRLLAHLRRWKERRLIANSFVEFNGKPVASVKKGVPNGGRPCQASRQGHAAYAPAHSRDLVDAAWRADLGGYWVPGNVAGSPSGHLRPPPPRLSEGTCCRHWAERSTRFGG
jgi:hypothetical protein